MLNNKFRIKEIVYKDGHKQYVAQVQKSILFFIKYWKNVVIDYRCDMLDVYYTYCKGDTYEECYNKLKDYIEKEERYNVSTTVNNVNYFELLIK